ncbi:MAG: DNA-binding MarR family transcriptional regulator [Limisphaerales bacterium]|jgi:DNA-binding MarR family transcriptional regulator
MEIKKDNLNRMGNAMFNLMYGMKKGVDDCSKICGNLSDKEFLIITFVGQMQNVKMSEIAEQLSAPLSTLTSIVDRLVEGKYLIRYHSTEDRRVVLVALGANGKTTCDRFVEKKRSMAEDILSNFNEADQEKLIGYLEQVPSYSKESVEE